MEWTADMYSDAVNRLIENYGYSVEAARRRVTDYMDGGMPSREFEDAVLVTCSDVEAGR